jgi:hypothetical protein
MIRRGAQTYQKTKAQQRTRARLLRALAACDSNPADMLELYYWSREPGFTQLVRAIATMQEHTRAALEAFIVLACDSKSIAADLDPCGMLTFYSPQAARSAVLALRIADEAEDRPHLLN